MPLFICEKCGAIENTALGHYWCREYFKFKDASLNNKALCSECAPLEFDDGQKTGNNGKWHGRFKKEFFDKSKDDAELFMNGKAYLMLKAGISGEDLVDDTKDDLL